MGFGPLSFFRLVCSFWHFILLSVARLYQVLEFCKPYKASLKSLSTIIIGGLTIVENFCNYKLTGYPKFLF